MLPPQPRKTMPEPAEKLDELGFAEEALANFEVLIDDTEYEAYLEMMGIGRLQFLRRKQMRVEILGLRMALWRLALARSFPKHADWMFREFLERFSSSHPDKNSRQAVRRGEEYWDMLAPGGDSDFQVVARHLASFQEQGDPGTIRALVLRLALAIRRDYKFIFERLI